MCRPSFVSMAKNALSHDTARPACSRIHASSAASDSSYRALRYRVTSRSFIQP